MNSESVSLVIPGRNCSTTIRACLSSVVSLLDDAQSPLDEILLVDDASTDDTRAILAAFPVRVVPGSGGGPGAARNLGWRAARNPLIWFMDSDCVAEPDALRVLLAHMDDPAVGGVSGSYGIMNSESLLARLIHEEIIVRHARMPTAVDFLATFNVLYRRSALERVNGFDERYLKGQDAELSFRVMEAGYRLHFDLGSRVKHFHESRWFRYLDVQRRQGYWRAWLHMRYPRHNRGDSYSNLMDHCQPPLALLSLATLPLLATPYTLGATVAPLMLLGSQIPMTFAIVRRLRSPGYLLHAVMSFMRAYWRGVGLAQGLLTYLFRSSTDASAQRSPSRSE